jgi:hypothetical protein
VYIDTNENGTYEVGEDPIKYAMVYLGIPTDDDTPKQTMDEDGNITFENVPLGEYSLVVVPPSNFPYMTTKNNGDNDDTTPPLQQVAIVHGDNPEVDKGFMPGPP